MICWLISPSCMMNFHMMLQSNFSSKLAVWNESEKIDCIALADMRYVYPIGKGVGALCWMVDHLNSDLTTLDFIRIPTATCWYIMLAYELKRSVCYSVLIWTQLPILSSFILERMQGKTKRSIYVSKWILVKPIFFWQNIFWNKSKMPYSGTECKFQWGFFQASHVLAQN